MYGTVKDNKSSKEWSKARKNIYIILPYNYEHNMVTWNFGLPKKLINSITIERPYENDEYEDIVSYKVNKNFILST